MENLNLEAVKSDYYLANEAPQLITLKATNYLSITGVGSPKSQRFTKSIESIYAAIFALKEVCKQMSLELQVPMMEAQWWVESGIPFEETPQDDWYWDIMLPLPDFATNDMVNDAVEAVIKQKQMQLAAEIQLKPVDSQKVVQALHKGSYEKEAPTIKKIFDYMQQEGVKPNGHHHEIYINDPYETPEDDLETIIRYAVK